MKVLREAVRNATMGVNAIDNVMPYVEDGALIKVMKEQQQSLSELLQEAKQGLSSQEIEDAEGSKLSKTMLKASSSFSAMVNNDSSHVAKMLKDGYEMGIASLQKCINEIERVGEEIPQCAKDLIKTYDKHIRTLRKFL